MPATIFAIVLVLVFNCWCREIGRRHPAKLIGLGCLVRGVDRMEEPMSAGILKLVSLGGLGILYIIDLILDVTGKMTDSTGLPLRR
jgi:hypothetical protein